MAGAGTNTAALAIGGESPQTTIMREISLNKQAT